MSARAAPPRPDAPAEAAEAPERGAGRDLGVPTPPGDPAPPGPTPPPAPPGPQEPPAPPGPQEPPAPEVPPAPDDPPPDLPPPPTEPPGPDLPPDPEVPPGPDAPPRAEAGRTGPPPPPPAGDGARAVAGAPTSDQLRHAIDAGGAADKKGAADPAAAPLGADDEAAGASPAPAQRAAAWSQEVEGRKGGTPAERGGHPISAPPPGSRTVHWPWPWMIAMGVITVLFLAAAAIV